MNLSTDLHTQDESASILRKSKAWLERARWAGTGPRYTRIGRTIYYTDDDLAAYIDGNRRTCTREGE